MTFRAGKLAPAVLVIASLISGGAAAVAQQVTGTLGQPSATTTIKGNQIPAPPPAFGGVIKEDAKDSTSWWPDRKSVV